MLEFVNVMLKEISYGLPPMRDIHHQIDLIPISVLPNKPTYRMGPKEHEELKMKVDDSLYKGLIRESEIPYVVPALLASNKDGSWRMCVDCQPIRNLFVHEEVRFNIEQRVEHYEKQGNEVHLKVVFYPGGWIWLHMDKERFPMQRRSKLHARAHDPSRIINKIGENAYWLKLLDDYDT